ncbi:MAG: NDP-sugar synthase [Actinomycetota bacterium]|nr:NDP-sugar synthase [Actinomycetota bacterium]
MKAFILAGGFGTRLRPLTLTRPKHLLPIANRPHIEHVFDLLLRHGIDEVVLMTSYLAEAFADTLAGAEQMGMKLEVTHEAEPLGTAGALKNAEHLVGDDAFLAFNGDVLTNVDLSAVIDRHRARQAEASIVLTPVDDPSAYGVVPTKEDGSVLGFIEKPPRDQAPSNLINAGIYVLEPSILERIPVDRVWSAERELFPQLVAEGARLFASGTDAYWMDIGTPEKYVQANMDALSGTFPTNAVDAIGPDGVLAAEPCEIGEGARVSSACLGAGARVASGATVSGSVLLPSASVGEGATVVNCALGERAVVTAGARIENGAIGDGEIIE